MASEDYITIVDSTICCTVESYSNGRRGKEVTESENFLGLSGASWYLKMTRDKNKFPSSFGFEIEGFPEERLPGCRYKFDVYCGGEELVSSKVSVFRRYNMLDSLIKDVTSNLVRARLFIQCPVGSYLSMFTIPKLSADALKSTCTSTMNDPTFSDFTFNVKGTEFKLHRNILAASSPVFRKLFVTDFGEAKNGTCQIDHIQPEIFEVLIRFIYCAELPENVHKVAKPLFEAAHYYEIEALKQICVEVLQKKITAEIAVDAFKVACIYEFEQLRIDSWKIIKRDILKETKPFKTEPLPLPELLRILELQSKMRDIMEIEQS